MSLCVWLLGRQSSSSEIFGEGRAEVLTATGCTIPGKVWGGFEDQVRIGDQVFEGQQ
jgi:hypothetical protein